MKTIKQKKLASIEIDVDDTGFTIWIYEKTGKNQYWHWLVDGSDVKNDGMIRLGKSILEHKYEAVYDEDTNAIRLVKKDPK